jgi:hypothetical protein
LVRIFSALAIVAMLLLAANFFVGLAGGDFNAAATRKREVQRALVEARRQSRLQGQRETPELEKAQAAAAAAEAEYARPRQWMTLHMLLGSAAALLSVLVSSITITYFVGTSRWCKEVCETYRLAPALAEKSTRLKRSTFPWTLLGIGAVIFVVGLGAAADPSGANWRHSASLVLPHYLAAMACLVVVGASYWVQGSRIAENYLVIDEILQEVQRVRQERNLPAEEHASA